MSITLSYSGTNISLDELTWNDEHRWSPVVQEVQRGLTGSIIVHAAALQAGRPVTLQSSDRTGWLRLAAVKQLRNWAAGPGQTLTLTVRGDTFSVVFRHQDAPALEADPVFDVSDPEDDDFYRVALRLMTV